MSFTSTRRCLVLGLFCFGLVAGCGKGGKEESIAELTKQLNDPSWEVRAEAAEKLRFRVPEGKEAVPQLFELLDDEHQRCREWGSDALAAHGEEAYPLLAGGLSHKSARVRAMSWRGIGSMKRDVKIAHSDEFAANLEAGLSDKELAVRHYAAYAFNKTDMLSPKSVPIAIRHLKPDENKMILCYILDALSNCPEDVRRSALPQLREMAKVNDTEVRGLAGGHLASLGEANPNPPAKSGPGRGPSGPRGESSPAPPRKSGGPDAAPPPPPDAAPPPEKKR